MLEAEKLSPTTSLNKPTQGELSKFREVPKDLEAERALIAMVLMHPEKFLEVSTLISAKDFYDLPHQYIWETIGELTLQDEEINIVTMRSQLRKRTDLINPPAVMTVLGDCFNYEFYKSNIDFYVTQVRDKSMLRSIIKVGTVHTLSAYIDSADPTNVLSNFEKDLLDVASTNDVQKSVDVFDVVEEVHTDMVDVEENGWTGLSTGFEVLDERTGGLVKTQVWIIGAYTGVGKTWFLLQLILNVLRAGGKVVLFSTEMDRKLNILRLIGNIAGVGTIAMLRGTLLDPEKEEVKKAMAELQTYKDSFSIYDSVYSIDDIRLKCKKLKLTKGLDVAVVDFIQNLKGAGSIYDRMSEAAVELQQMAQELDITMLIGSQVSQSAAGWKSKESIDFKGAGEIAAIADVALWLSRVKNEHEMSGLRDVIMRKVRHGSGGNMRVNIRFPSGSIVYVPKDTDGITNKGGKVNDTERDQLDDMPDEVLYP